MSEKTTVLVVEDHPLVCDGIVKLLGLHDKYHVVGSSSDGVPALDLVRKHQPDVVILDISLSSCSGLDLCPVLLEASPETRVVFLTMYGQPAYIRKALSGGAMGYVLKSAPSQQLLDAIDHVDRGEFFLSPEVNKVVIDNFTGPAKTVGINTENDTISSQAKSMLSARELQVLEIYLTGSSSKEIARLLCLSSKTVDKHRANIFEKTKSRSHMDLLRFAIDNKMIDPQNWV
ncbi:MAG: response regulator transcription factor [Thermodesulfobacteriota bacterium]